MPKHSLFVLCAAISFFATLLLCRTVIPFLMKKKLGQTILEIGPRWHKNKEGTPTMGGICFIVPILLCSLAALPLALRDVPTLIRNAYLLTLIYALANALIGLVDDLTKFKKKQNQGLTPRQKLVLQVSFATGYLAMLRLYGIVQTELRIPFTETYIELGALYYFLALVLLVGIVNCANLTDGIDGLATTEAAILSGFLAVSAVLVSSLPVLIISATVFGGALGFLIFNYHPARVFMGDTGSLFFGAILAGCAFMLGAPLLIVISGLLYVLEGVSVILQVVYYKLTHGKRLFLMAPLHHHFEKRGWSEVKVVCVFSFFSILFCIAAFAAYF